MLKALGIRTGSHLWARHRAVDNHLTFGERAADVLKKWFGTWTIFGLVIAICSGYLLWVHDPGELHLNLGLSLMAAVQGIILQISANRGDKKSAEVALHTQENTDALRAQSVQILEILDAQNTMLGGIAHIQAELNMITASVVPGAPDPGVPLPEDGKGGM